jgi:L-alanine-DL-glutamate epimerase-like enolase superfamily enzyme
VSQATELAHAAQNLGVAWFEEPLVVSDDLRGMAELRLRTTVPLATGEREHTRFAFRDIIVAKAADVLQPDIGTVGGITELRRVAALAHVFGLTLAPHCFSSAVASAACVQVAAASPSVTLVECRQGPAPLMYELCDQRVGPARDGYIPVPNGPGLGITVSNESLRRFQPQD